MMRGTVPPSAFIRPTSRRRSIASAAIEASTPSIERTRINAIVQNSKPANAPQNRSLGGGDLTHRAHIERRQIVRKRARDRLDFRGRSGNAQLHKAHSAGEACKILRGHRDW